MEFNINDFKWIDKVKIVPITKKDDGFFCDYNEYSKEQQEVLYVGACIKEFLSKVNIEALNKNSNIMYTVVNNPRNRTVTENTKTYRKNEDVFKKANALFLNFFSVFSYSYISGTKVDKPDASLIVHLFSLYVDVYKSASGLNKNTIKMISGNKSYDFYNAVLDNMTLLKEHDV